MSTNLALGLVNQTAGIVGENISQTLTGLSETIGRDALNLKVNKEIAVTLSVHIKDLVAAINEALEVQDGEALKPTWAHTLASFNRVLNDAQVALDKLQCKSHIMQLLHQRKDADMLKELSDRVSNAFGLLKLRVNIDMATNADTIHRVLDSAATALADMQAEPLPPSAARLPSPPPAYVGRTEETTAIVEMLSGPNQAFMAVLGGPGMGKTSVAVAALHATEVETKFTTRRYFIACDAADGLSSLLTTLCTGLGIQFESPKSAQKALKQFLATAPCVLLLDNFESVWEAASTRQNTEDLLSSLASISTVSIIITLRGSELPAGLAWSCPLLPPLQPLQNDAAVQLFLSISDTSDDEKHLQHLLGVLGNIPLAVVLMANLAQWESLERLIAQWAEMKTAMLRRSHGADHIACLDVSIELSLASPRMQEQPHAGRLLSLLALLPAGAAELDVTLWASDIPQPAHVSSRLLQTALAYHTPENRISLLTPIQEFMLTLWCMTDFSDQ
ncbi:hypothetical protein EXIGLDRAFT_759383 [Exidia glandulosa HHB12029]|uniref:Novel STAND NTPase 1 domain-containing protein n=1 Tax=Exidia glandulosa HHB12029 TaxID=1314781 RepID=A0A165Q4Q5_EXIGL|nr:hypothetical protein EXIGLDRAFT_759383 [Exidia glandulosa HHB12029]